MTVIALVGVGKLGEALLSGLLASGHDAGSIRCVVRRPERAGELAERYGVDCQQLGAAVAVADVVVLMVKPYDVVAMAGKIADALQPGTIVVSVAAGVPTGALEEALPPGTAVVRVMPNTPAQVRQGVSAASAGAHADTAAVERVAEVFRSVGSVVVVPEAQQDAVTAVSGSGPAYVFYVAEALIEAGVQQGLPRPTATRLAVDTLAGAATLLRESGETPARLRENVTSPGGTTAAGLRALDDHGARSAIYAAVAAAKARSEELAN